jgi:hypothetical protein
MHSKSKPRAWAVLLARGLVVAAPLLLPLGASAQKAFASAQAAAEALVDAVARNDDDAVKVVLGADYARVLPVKEVDRDDVLSFLAGWAQWHGIAPRDERTAFLEIGESRWSLPIPIVKGARGWAFDPRGAEAELRTRRIGRNELDAMKVALAYTDAQEDYYRADPDRDGVKAFATRLLSTAGRRDGLYWPTLEGEAPSPLGPLLALPAPGQSYKGYHYRILTAQGAAAPGGAKSYLRDGRMTEGFALVAWPARYGDTGVTSFIVSRDGVVYEKDLGPRTDAIARAMKAYDPDRSWSKVDVPD